MNKHIIYTLSNPLCPNDIRYVGATSLSIEKRKQSHLHSAKHKKKNYYNAVWIRSLLKMNLEPHIEIIDECDESDWENSEIYWINQMRAWGFKLTNTTGGGIGAKHMSKEIRQKISELNKGKTPWNKGIPCKEETKIKLSNSLKGKVAWNKGIPCFIGENNPMFGKKRSIEVTEKIKNYWNNISEEKKKNINSLISDGNSKSVLQYTKKGILIKEWKSAVEAYRNTNINKSHIGECCRGKRKSAGDYVWKYNKKEIFINKK